MSSVLIGSTGFVGGALQRTNSFDLLVHRANLRELEGRHWRRIVCAGLPAAKWIANKQPEEDLRNMRTLCAALDGVGADHFVLISTIDVYPVLEGADENFDCRSLPNHAYGSHRLQFEEHVRKRFPNALIVRLPALFGAGLRKNVLFDLINDNGLDAINPESEFQWYPTARLHDDIGRAESLELRLVNLFTEAVPTRELLRRFFPDKTVGGKAALASRYRLTTRHAPAFGGHSGYIASAEEVLRQIGEYVRVERKTA